MRRECGGEWAVSGAVSGWQVELARLLEANTKLQRKVDACQHNTDETHEAVEDMQFQLAQVECECEM